MDVTVSKELRSEVIELIRIYTEEPELVIDPNHPESESDFNELVAYLKTTSEQDKSNTLNIELCHEFVTQLETSLRSSGQAKGALYRAVCKFYVDSGLAVPLDTKAYKNGLAGCTGGIKGATWFTYNKVAYEPK